MSFSIARGRTLALVGESGLGKSVTSYSIFRLVQNPSRIVGGKIILNPTRAGPIDIAQLGDDSEQLCHMRGGLVSMIFHEPMTALPHTIGSQIAEAILIHQQATATEARQRTVAMLASVGISDPERRLNNIRMSFPAACANAS